MCRGGLRIAGLITRGQVLDWCPPAVLFYPIRNSICCPTQLLSGHTSHPHRWDQCVFLMCVGVWVCLCCCCLYKQWGVRVKKQSLYICVWVQDFMAYTEIKSAHRSNLILCDGPQCFLNPSSFLYTQNRVTLTVAAPLIRNTQVFRWVAWKC